jgi:hypothetical protein
MSFHELFCVKAGFTMENPREVLSFHGSSCEKACLSAGKFVESQNFLEIILRKGALSAESQNFP